MKYWMHLQDLNARRTSKKGHYFPTILTFLRDVYVKMVVIFDEDAHNIGTMYARAL